MAIKITKPIGTDKGITSEAYVRIINYSIDKNGYTTFKIKTYLNAEDASSNLACTNQLIGDYFNVSFRTEIESEESNNNPKNRLDKNYIIDLSPLENVNIFNFGYENLKKHLGILFGEENLEDC